MSGKIGLASCLGLLGALVANATTADMITLEELASGLDSPLEVVHAGDGSGRLFLVLQPGLVRVWDGTEVLPEPFLDIRDRVLFGGEQGLLGLAFHPSYPANGQFYVNYSDEAGDNIVARYRVSADPNRADSSTEEVLLTIEQPYSNHNGGRLVFGPGGYLYIGTGDGGSGNDPDNRAQDLDQLLGKLLRIDVDSASPYLVPPDNPFVGEAGARPEIWAYGLRNPWRFSFDRENGDLFIGDVGQNQTEEIDLQRASSPGGENYGWRRMEGSECFNPPTFCDDGTLVLPILEYPHSGDDGFNCSVIGGYRYRGAESPGIGGIYVYGDYCSGNIWGGLEHLDGAWRSILLAATGLRITSFGEDESGELYLVDADGGFFRIRGEPHIFCDLAMSQNAYTNGQTPTLMTQRAGNPTRFGIQAALGIRIRTAQGEPVSPLRRTEIYLAAGAIVDLGPETLGLVGPDSPRGDYAVTCELKNAVTREPLASDTASFSVE